jgi:hypothetical protein
VENGGSAAACRYWNRVNSAGYTLFVEDSATWIGMITDEHPELQGKVFQ